MKNVFDQSLDWWWMCKPCKLFFVFLKPLIHGFLSKMNIQTITPKYLQKIFISQNLQKIFISQNLQKNIYFSKFIKNIIYQIMYIKLSLPAINFYCIHTAYILNYHYCHYFLLDQQSIYIIFYHKAYILNYHDQPLIFIVSTQHIY